MNATFNRTLVGVIAGVITLGTAVAISSTPAFARDLPGGAREPSPAGNVQGGQGGGGCKGAACNEKGPPTPVGVKTFPSPSRPAQYLLVIYEGSLGAALSVRPVGQSEAATRAQSASRMVRGARNNSVPSRGW